MGINTVPYPPYSRDLAPCDFWLFPKLSLWDNWGDERGYDEGHWHAHTRGLPWWLREVVEMVQQVHCSQSRLLRRGVEFHVYTINKSAHAKKRSGNLLKAPRIMSACILNDRINFIRKKIFYTYIIIIVIIMPPRISLTLSRHPSQSSIAPSWSSRLHPVSAQSCCI